MTMTVHKDLTGADLHEPKGVDTASSGQVYVSDGAGSGAWVAASDIITNTAWSTGDLKPTHKATADATWILWSDGTIGDGSSGATIRANADCAALFTLYWNGYSNTLCPVSSGRGASAAADFAAHKTLAVPVGAGRVFGLAGSGSGLTARTAGTVTGAETHVLTTSEIPSHYHSASISDSGHAHTVPFLVSGSFGGGGGGNFAMGAGVTSTSLSGTGVRVNSSNGLDTTYSAGGGGAHTIIQPTTFINVMIKL